MLAGFCKETHQMFVTVANCGHNIYYCICNSATSATRNLNGDNPLLPPICVFQNSALCSRKWPLGWPGRVTWDRATQCPLSTVISICKRLFISLKSFVNNLSDNVTFTKRGVFEYLVEGIISYPWEIWFMLNIQHRMEAFVCVHVPWAHPSFMCRLFEGTAWLWLKPSNLWRQGSAVGMG